MVGGTSVSSQEADAYVDEWQFLFHSEERVGDTGSCLKFPGLCC